MHRRNVKGHFLYPSKEIDTKYDFLLVNVILVERTYKRIAFSHIHLLLMELLSFSVSLTFALRLFSGEANSCCHSVVCTLSIKSSHSSGAQSYSDIGSCSGGFCHLLVPLLHLIHLHGHKGKYKPP